MDRKLPVDNTHFASRKISNAFNPCDRDILLDQVAKVAPRLSKLARWLYESDLTSVVADETGQLRSVTSAQSILQGVPFGPLFFSIAIRPQDRSSAGGIRPRAYVLAYLDDIIILSPDSSINVRAAVFGARPDLVLQETKSKPWTFPRPQTEWNCYIPVTRRVSGVKTIFRHLLHSLSPVGLEDSCAWWIEN